MSNYFTVTILAPDKVLFQDKVTTLAAANSEGPFSIMADHARFMAILNKEPVVLYNGNEITKTFTFNTAVLYFSEDEARIYTHFEPESGYTDKAT